MGEYGRKVKVKITETTKGMNAEVPIMDETFDVPFESKGRKKRVATQWIDYMVRHGWIEEEYLFNWTADRIKVLTPAMIRNVMRKDIDLKRLLFDKLPYKDKEENNEASQI